jgi:hypothetical protein
MSVQTSPMLRLSLAYKSSRESMYSVLASLDPKSGSTRSRMDRRLGGGAAAMLAQLSSAQISQSDKLLHSVGIVHSFAFRNSTQHLAAGRYIQRLLLFRRGGSRRSFA